MIRRSDYDVFLEDSDEFSIGREYVDSFMETPIDFVSVFPEDFEGSPNITVTPDGRRFSPRARSEDRLDLFDEALTPHHSHSPDFAASVFREMPSPDLSRKPDPVMTIISFFIENSFFVIF